MKAIHHETNTERTARLLGITKGEAIQLYIEVQKLTASHVNASFILEAAIELIKSHSIELINLDVIAKYISEKVEVAKVGSGPGYNGKQIQQACIKSQYDFVETLRILQGCVSTSQIPYTWEVSKIYPQLTVSDRQLAALWITRKGDEYYEAQMLSARGAEKVAKQFYESLGCQVTDVAMTQLDGSSTDWLSYDLLLDEKVPVDVKNARAPYYGNSYVEHSVKRLKLGRQGREVRIAGVLSPYLQLKFINDTSEIFFDSKPVIFLGETTKLTIDKLLRDFRRPNIEVINDTKTLIPAWMFDYPSEFYRKRYESRIKLRTLDLNLLPDKEIFDSSGFNAVASFLAAGVPLPEQWQGDLAEWQRNLYNDLVQHSPQLSLPILFLTLLTHFLITISTGQLDKTFSPESYKDLLYPNKNRTRHPLGIVDPLGTIHNFCSTLNDLWKHRDTVGLEQFTLFKFYGEGLLKGRKRNENQYITIIAYCGGWIEGKGKCGNSPLIIGKHKNCLQCGKLICPRCQFCSKNCTRYLQLNQSTE
jgi:hypothetical protein